MLRGAIGGGRTARVISLSDKGGKGYPPVGGHAGSEENKGKASLSTVDLRDVETWGGEGNYLVNSEGKQVQDIGDWRNSSSSTTNSQIHEGGTNKYAWPPSY